MRWVDSHCHLQGLEDGPDVIARAVEAGVERMVCVGTDLESSREAVAIAADHPEVWATVGLHPHEAERLADEWDGLADLAGADRVVGVGETGFDFHYMHSSPEDQETAFRAHVRLARATGLTLVIHTREAWPETFRVLEEEGVPERTVFHCFTGGVAEARRAVDLGTWVSFSGIVTFPNADDVQAAAASVPAERALVETDAPYLTPVPHRGRRNEPAYVVHVAHGLAAASGRPVEAVAEASRAATEAVFDLPA